MKHIYKIICIAIIASLFPIFLSAQSIQSVFNKYSKNDQFRYVSITGSVVNLASFFGKGDAGNDQMLSRIDNMKVLTFKGQLNSDLAINFSKDVEKSIFTEPPFNNLMEAREKGVYTRVLNRVNKNKKTDILIISKSDSTQHYIWLNGDISTQEFQSMIKK